jgi:integrase/recombinase XerC
MDGTKRLNIIPIFSVGLQKSPSICNLLQTFFEGRNCQTLVAYKNDLNDFARFLKVHTLEEAASFLLSNGHGNANGKALSYRSHLKDCDLQPTTINRRLSSLRSLMKLARTIGLITWELEVKNLRIEAYRDTKGPGKSNFEKLLGVATRKGNAKAIRDRAILRLLYDLALRASEVINLDIDDLNTEGSTISVLRKGRTQKKILTLPKPTLNALIEWLEIRHRFECRCSALFLNFDRSNKGKTKRLTRGGLYDLISLMGKKLNIKVRPHGLRHTSITEAIKIAKSKGMGLDDVLDHSGHANVTTLMIYNDREKDMQGQIASMVATLVKD